MRDGGGWGLILCVILLKSLLIMSVKVSEPHRYNSAEQEVPINHCATTQTAVALMPPD